MARISGHESLLSDMLEDIEEKISAVLSDQERNGKGLNKQIKQQIKKVKKVRQKAGKPEEAIEQEIKLNAYHMHYWRGLLTQLIAQILQVAPETLQDEKELDRQLSEEAFTDEIRDQVTQIVFSALMLGIYRGQRFSLDQDDYFELLYPLFHKKTSSSYRKAQHDEIKKKFTERIKPALAEAEKLWSGGDKRHHGEMADYLLSKYPKIKNNIPKNWNPRIQLMRALIPIAKKFSKVRGFTDGQEPAYAPSHNYPPD